MMHTTRPIRRRAAVSGLLAAAGLSLVTALAGCAGMTKLKKPTVEVAEVRIASFDREAAQLTVLLKVDNPNASELTLTDMKADFFLADTLLAQAVSTQPKVALLAQASVIVPMKVTVTYKTLPDVLQKSAAALVSGGLPYRITGSVTTQNGLTVLPFEKTGDILGMR